MQAGFPERRTHDYVRHGTVSPNFWRPTESRATGPGRAFADRAARHAAVADTAYDKARAVPPVPDYFTVTVLLFGLHNVLLKASRIRT